MTRRKWQTSIGIGLSLLLASWQSLTCAAAFAADPASPANFEKSLPARQSQPAVPIRLAALSAGSLPALTPGAVEAASLLGILPKVERLRQLGQAHPDGQPMTDEEMALKVDILDRVMGGSLEVRMVAGRIDRELSWAFNGQGMLQARRQKLLNYLFAATFMQGGVLGVLSGPAFLDKKPQVGTELLLLASSIGLALSSISFVVARTSPTKHIDSETTVLAYVFDLNPPEPLHKPDVVTKFMRAVPPDAKDNKTRVQSLMEGWKKGHFLRSTDQISLRKLAAYQNQGENLKENISLLGSRIRMLFDTQWTIEQLDAELLELLRATDVS